jgi:LPS sulfotransferase NodH
MIAELINRASKDEPLDYIPNYRKAYVVAITPRSGSAFLCDLLTSTGKVGKPMEFFNSGFMTLPKYSGASSLENYFSKVVSETKTDNDVFGMKISYGQALPLIEKGLLKQLLPNARIIVLFRRNIIKQAVSLHIAARLDHFHTGDRNEGNNDLLDNMEFDSSALFKRVKAINYEEKGWLEYLDSEATSYMKLFYEDNISDIDQSITSIGAYIGLDGDNLAKSAHYESRFKKTATKVNSSFYEMYLSNKNLMNKTHDLGLREERWL